MKQPPRQSAITVHVGRVDDLLKHAEFGAVLSDGDTRQALAIRSPQQRKAFLAARVLLRRLLAAVLGCAPAAVPIQRDVSGKLRVKGEPIHFSLSHAESWCAVALSTDCAVGVDIERIRPVPGWANVVRSFFPGSARLALHAGTRENRLQLFFRWWTRIEAAVKACAQGLDDGVSCFRRVVCQECEALLPNLALAVAARSGDGTVTTTWHLHLRSDFESLAPSQSVLACSKASAILYVAPPENLWSKTRSPESSARSVDTKRRRSW